MKLVSDISEVIPGFETGVCKDEYLVSEAELLVHWGMQRAFMDRGVSVELFSEATSRIYRIRRWISRIDQLHDLQIAGVLLSLTRGPSELMLLRTVIQNVVNNRRILLESMLYLQRELSRICDRNLLQSAHVLGCLLDVVRAD
jgi:hypothetical protein